MGANIAGIKPGHHHKTIFNLEDKMKKIEVSLAALDTLTRMVEELQAERDVLYSVALRVANLNRNAGEIGAGMLASLVDDARMAIGQNG